jgi:hypothetical protein
MRPRALRVFFDFKNVIADYFVVFLRSYLECLHMRFGESYHGLSQLHYVAQLTNLKELRADVGMEGEVAEYLFRYAPLEQLVRLTITQQPWTTPLQYAPVLERCSSLECLRVPIHVLEERNVVIMERVMTHLCTLELDACCYSNMTYCRRLPRFARLRNLILRGANLDVADLPPLSRVERLHIDVKNFTSGKREKPHNLPDNININDRAWCGLTYLKLSSAPLLSVLLPRDLFPALATLDVSSYQTRIPISSFLGSNATLTATTLSTVILYHAYVDDTERDTVRRIVAELGPSKTVLWSTYYRPLVPSAFADYRQFVPSAFADYPDEYPAY